MEALEKSVRGISERVGRTLELLRLLVRNLGNSFLISDSPLPAPERAWEMLGCSRAYASERVREGVLSRAPSIPRLSAVTNEIAYQPIEFGCVLNHGPVAASIEKHQP